MLAGQTAVASGLVRVGSIGCRRLVGILLTDPAAAWTWTACLILSASCGACCGLFPPFVYVQVKCATITPDAGRVTEFGLKKMYRSPNGQIRGILNGTVFREPILCSNVPRIIPGWKAPIIVGRHAYADQYACQDMLTPACGGKLTMRFEPADGGDAVERTVFEFGQGQSGIALTMYNTDDSIRGFARSSFLYAQSRGMPLYLATKNTILKVYDGRFADIFAEVGKEFPDVQYEMRLIDDMVAQMGKLELSLDSLVLWHVGAPWCLSER